MAEVTLLPRKAFEIKLSSGEVIKGQYSLWATKRFTDRKKITLSGLSELLDVDSITMDDICQFLLCAVEYTTRKERKPFNYTDVDACDWIEELGGIGGDNYLKLVNHGQQEEPTDEDGEKKNQPSGEISSESVLVPE